jgi:YegS/Rv2252/BmrU family lipid kinase
MVKRAFIVVNPVAGNMQRKHLDQAVAAHLGGANIEYKQFETTGKPTDRQRIREAVEAEYDLYIAAGGDGTVSMVADALVHRPYPMGILPLGTGNGLARTLQIPLDVRSALNLIAGDHQITEIDAMRIDGRIYTLAAGTGLSATALRAMDVEMKKRIGRLHYFLIGAKAFIGFQPRRFQLEVDGKQKNARGREALVINCPGIGDPYIRWDEELRIDDGAVDLYVMRARTALDFLHLGWSALLGKERQAPPVIYLQGRERIRISTKPPVPTQGDGDLLGETPLEIEVLPQAVRVVVSANYEGSSPVQSA